jgi:16S rRNA processing protein RimM
LKQKFIEAGKIIGSHGIAGEVKIVPWCDSPEFLLGFSTLYLEGKPVKVISTRVHKGNVLAVLEGVSDRNQADLLKGRTVSISREDSPLPSKRHFLADVVGLEVREAETGKVLGTVSEILTLPAQSVYVVKGEREILIPAVDAFIMETNVEGGYLIVRLIEGM